MEKVRETASDEMRCVVGSDENWHKVRRHSDRRWL